MLIVTEKCVIKCNSETLCALRRGSTSHGNPPQSLGNVALQPTIINIIQQYIDAHTKYRSLFETLLAWGLKNYAIRLHCSL